MTSSISQIGISQNVDIDSICPPLLPPPKPIPVLGGVPLTREYVNSCITDVFQNPNGY